jgi:hypothetical protein
MSEDKKVVRAIDLGFGFTKFVEKINENGEYKCRSFPSIATRKSNKVLGGGFFNERDTIC